MSEEWKEEVLLMNDKELEESLKRMMFEMGWADLIQVEMIRRIFTDKTNKTKQNNKEEKQPTA